MDSNTVLTIATVVVVIILFIAMIFSGIASSLSSPGGSNKGCETDTTHKYSMYSAIMYAVSIVLILILFFLYKYSANST